MNNNQEKIHHIISREFEKNFFYNFGSNTTIENIDTKIIYFENKYPLIIRDLLVNLTRNFPDARIENWTHFFNHDRCVKFLIQISEELRFVCQVSIFNFFSIYQHSANKIDGVFKYGEVSFLNPNESKIADTIYTCLGPEANEFIWLNKTILNEVVEDFSILDEDPLFRFEIKVADVIFSDHYL